MSRIVGGTPAYGPPGPRTPASTSASATNALPPERSRRSSSATVSMSSGAAPVAAATRPVRSGRSNGCTSSRTAPPRSSSAIEAATASGSDWSVRSVTTTTARPVEREDERPQQVQRGDVGPVDVLDRQCQRLLGRLSREPAAECLEQAHPLERPVRGRPARPVTGARTRGRGRRRRRMRHPRPGRPAPRPPGAAGRSPGDPPRATPRAGLDPGRGSAPGAPR